MGALRSRSARALAISVAYLGTYALAALWARDLTVVGGASPWFPGAGLSLGLLIVGGPRWAPLLVAGELISSQLIFAVPFSPLQDAINALSTAAILTAAAVALRAMLGRPPSLRSAAELRRFVGLGVVAAPALIGVSGYSLLAWSGVGSWSDFAEGWRAYAVGDAVGIAVVAPLLIAVAGRLASEAPLRRPALGTEAIVQAVAVAGVPLLPMLLSSPRPVLLGMTLMPVAWVALTRSFLVTMLATLVAASATTISAHAELGESTLLTDVQLLLLMMSLLGLAIAVAMRVFRRTQTMLAVRASQDPLSGLANRRIFVEEVARRLAGGRQIAVLFVDLDRFKLINDTLGHEVGDRLLTVIAGRLARSGDPGQTMIARFGGDEFTAVTGDGEVSAWISGEQMADRILDELARPIAIGGRTISVDVSIGIAVGEPGEDPNDLIAQADLAMFTAKGRGGSCVSMFDDEMGARAERRSTLERGLRDALEGGGLWLEFQPIVPLHESAAAGVEALLRWRDAAGQLVGPAEFIPIAEETGLILRIGRWVLVQACAEAERWRGAERRPTIWVNVSAAELREPDFVEFVISTLEAAGLEGDGCLGLELTEGVLVEDTEAVLETLGRLHDAGVKLALDDFGTGYSSLGYLQRLPIDAIKIDRRFVSKLSEDADDPVAATITDLAHRLELAVVGEGVENEAQLAALERLGCDLAQGWLLGRPGTIEAASEAVVGQRPRETPLRS